jgi:hypothetical protein
MEEKTIVMTNVFAGKPPKSWEEELKHFCALPSSCITEKMFFAEDSEEVTGGRALFDNGLLDKNNIRGWMLKPVGNNDKLPYEILQDGLVPEHINDDILLSVISCPAKNAKRFSKLTRRRTVASVLAEKQLLSKETALRLLGAYAATDIAPFLDECGVTLKDTALLDEVLNTQNCNGTTVAMALAGVGMLPEEKFDDYLGVMNNNGNTLLHFAACFGSLPKRFTSDEMMSCRNEIGFSVREELLLSKLRSDNLGAEEETELREALLRPLGSWGIDTLGLLVLSNDLGTAKLLPTDIIVQILAGRESDGDDRMPFQQFLNTPHHQGFGEILTEEVLNSECEASDCFGNKGRTFGEVFFLHIYNIEHNGFFFFNPTCLLNSSGNIPSGLTEKTLMLGADRKLPLAAVVSEMLPLPPLSREILSLRLGEQAIEFLRLDHPSLLAHFLASRGKFHEAMADMLPEEDDIGNSLAFVAAKALCLPDNLLTKDVLLMKGADGKTVASVLALSGKLPEEFMDDEIVELVKEDLLKYYDKERLSRIVASHRSFENVEEAADAVALVQDIDDERYLRAVSYLEKTLGEESSTVLREALRKIVDIEAAKRIVLRTVERDRNHENPKFVPAVEMLGKHQIQIENFLLEDKKAILGYFDEILASSHENGSCENTFPCDDGEPSPAEVTLEALRIVSILEYNNYKREGVDPETLRSFILKPIKALFNIQTSMHMVLSVSDKGEADAKRYLRESVRKLAEQSRREWESRPVSAVIDEEEEIMMMM